MAGITFNVDASGLNSLIAWNAAISRQLPYAQSVALNRLAYQVQQDLNAATSSGPGSFSSPTNYTKKAFFYTKSTKTDLTALVMAGNPQNPRDRRRAYIATQVFGGSRGRKTAERKAAAQASDNSLGSMRLVPTRHMRPHLDRFGNVPRRFWQGLPEAMGNRDGGWFIGRANPSWVPGIYRRQGRKIELWMKAVNTTQYDQRFPMRNVSTQTIRQKWPSLLTDATEQALRPRVRR